MDRAVVRMVDSLAWREVNYATAPQLHPNHATVEDDASVPIFIETHTARHKLKSKIPTLPYPPRAHHIVHTVLQRGILDHACMHACAGAVVSRRFVTATRSLTLGVAPRLAPAAIVSSHEGPAARASAKDATHCCVHAG